MSLKKIKGFRIYVVVPDPSFICGYKGLPAQIPAQGERVYTKKEKAEVEARVEVLKAETGKWHVFREVDTYR